MCKKLKLLDEHGAESSKIDATQASIRKLLTKLNVCVRRIDAISNRINKLRDEDLQPQLTKLIHGYEQPTLLSIVVCFDFIFYCSSKVVY